MIRIENPKLLAWFQTPQTVSRPSRPDFQPRKTNSGSRRPIEIFKKRKMIRIEFPKLLAWFQTHQTVSRPSRPSRPLVPDTSDRFQTVQTRFPALKLGHFLWKKNQNGPSGVHLTHYCPQHLAFISQMKVHTSTPEHWFQSPSSFHLPLPHEVVPHVDEVTLHWSRKLRNHILDRRLSR